MRLPRAGTIEIVPSVLAADFGHLAAEVAQVEAAGVKMIQFDIMDGHFVPNISFGPLIVAAVRPHSSLVFDVQLMVSEPPPSPRCSKRRNGKTGEALRRQGPKTTCRSRGPLQPSLTPSLHLGDTRIGIWQPGFKYFAYFPPGAAAAYDDLCTSVLS